MPKIKLPDLTDVEDVGTFNDMPKGLYVMKIREMTTSETGENSKNPGQPMGVIVLDPVRIVGGAKVKKGEYQGLFHRFPLDDSNPGWTPRLKEFVKAVGAKLKGGTLDEKTVEGKLVIAKVKDGKSEDGERRAELDKLMPYTEEAAGGGGGTDDDDDEEAEDLWTEEELKELSSADLREAAEELEVDVPEKLGPKAKAKVIDAILEAQDEDEGEEDEDGEDEAWDEESLGALGKAELAKVAAEFEVEMPGRLTTAAKNRAIAAILEAQGGDEDEDDEDDEDGDEDDEAYSEEDLEALSLSDLKTVATDEFELEVPKGKAALVKKKLVAAILEAQEESEDEDEDDEEDDGYDDMTQTQLAKEVRSRNGKVKAGMKAAAMITWLRENDSEDDEAEDDEDDLDPDSMDVDELKAALRERGIAVKGSEKVLRAKLVKSLEADDDGDPF